MINKITTYLIQCDTDICNMQVEVKVVYPDILQPPLPEIPENWKREILLDEQGAPSGEPRLVCPTCQIMKRIQAAEALQR